MSKAGGRGGCLLLTPPLSKTLRFSAFIALYIDCVDGYFTRFLNSVLTGHPAGLLGGTCMRDGIIF